MNFKFGVAVVVTIFVPPKRSIESIDWVKGKITGKSLIFMGKYRWFPIDVTLSQPIDYMKLHGHAMAMVMVDVDISNQLDTIFPSAFG